MHKSGKIISGYHTKTIIWLKTPTLDKVTAETAQVTMTWKKVSGATDYAIYRKSGTKSWIKIGTVDSREMLLYVDKNVKKGTTYAYTVQAVNGIYKSAYDTTGLSVRAK